MHDFAVLWDWIEFAVRWLHVITAIAWIGSSFYFVALDLGLQKRPGLPPGAHGEEWQVHGGGFYHIQKYLVAPPNMPEHLTWFKWESYATWLSGAALLAIVYWAGAELFLIDRTVLDVSAPTAILISAASIGLGWVVYDLLCKSRLGHSPTLLMVLLFGVIVVMSWAYTQVFSGRAALLHLGAFTATIMTANVFFIIIPNQKKVVEVLKTGGTPDPEYGRIAKLRSTHNNYLTLPVLFLMLSNHYPLAFASEYNWIIASLVFLMGVTIRHYFNTRHARAGDPIWTWPATAIIFIAIVWLSSMSGTATEERETALSAHEMRFASAPNFQEVANTVTGRCSMCHAAEVFWPGLIAPPGGVILETEQQIARQARAIYLQSGRTHAMPPGNVTDMEPHERQAIVDWYRAATARN
jgi:uncharacterized membrane protein